MKKTIFLNNDNVINTYVISIGEDMIKRIQKSIDNYSGKGELKEGIGGVDFFSTYEFCNKKVEILSSTYVKEGSTCDICCGEMSTISIYKYKYYAYKQHELSALCDRLLEYNGSIEQSYIIKQLLDYEPTTELEEKYLNQIIRSIKFNRVNPDKTVEIDIAPKEETLFRRVIRRLKNNIPEGKIIISSEAFEKSLDKYIRDMETFNEAFYSGELHGESLTYTPEERKEIRGKVLSYLPKSSQLSKSNVGN